jgi:hypothetical protein
VTTGAAFADALDGWSTACARVGAMLLWTAWAAGLLALFAPRPWGLTLLRITAPCGVVGVVLTVTSTSPGAALLAIAGSVIAAALVLSWPVATANANALAYGDEQRVPLRTPTPLLLGPIPLAVAVVAVGIAAGPLLVAAGTIVFGIAAIIVGIPLAVIVARSLHSLSRRWVVFVPAGIAVVDPLTLVDPVLVRREDIATLRRTSTTSLPGDALDLRSGTLAGGLRMELVQPVMFARRRGRADAEVVEPTVVAFAVPHVEAVIELADSHRIVTG